ncbi:ATP-binding cassette domain-containing protein [Streptomyces sp. NPDC005438]|uniref:ATP-binding cassette domain-containing protein n=1 Tax=Streptomyces sp. NPDC005438 TaxID=3156880 RepID=UPI00339FAD0A
MIQAIGLTSERGRRRARPSVEDLTFDARPGQVTVLLGPDGAGKTTALRLVLQLQAGRGVALIRGRPLHRVPHPAREVGVLMGDVPGHPWRTVAGHLRMLAAAAGVPATRVDAVMDTVGISGLADLRLERLSRGMDRRLGLAAALLGDPHTLVLDEPTRDLSHREARWLHGLLRAHAEDGGTVLVTSRCGKEAGRCGDRVVTLDQGRLVADQDAEDYLRTRLLPRIAVRSPHAERLAEVIRRQAVTAPPRPPQPAAKDDLQVRVVPEGGGRLSIYGSSRAAVGELAHQNGIMVHQLADETGTQGDRSPVGPLLRADGRPPAREKPTPSRPSRTRSGEGTQPSTVRPSPKSRGAAEAPARNASPRSADKGGATAGPSPRKAPSAGPRSSSLPPHLPVVSRPGPVFPVRYELRRLFSVPTGWVIMLLAVGLSGFTAFAMAWVQSATSVEVASSNVELVMGWPDSWLCPLPPVALAAGVLGALAFGEEFRYPALAPAQAPVPRRLGLLIAKLAVSAGISLLLCLVTAVANMLALRLFFGPESTVMPTGWGVAATAIAALTVGCGWAGVLASGIFRSVGMGVLAVLAVPTVVAPAVRGLTDGPGARAFDELPDRLMEWAPFPSGTDPWVAVAVRFLSQPMGQAMALSLTALLCLYALVVLRRGVG